MRVCVCGSVGARAFVRNDKWEKESSHNIIINLFQSAAFTRGYILIHSLQLSNLYHFEVVYSLYFYDMH